jgi:hypothetical protein
MKPKSFLCLALLLSGGLVGCSTVEHRTSDQPMAGATITELPPDEGLAGAMGVTMRTLTVNYPSSMELTVTRRIYRNGVLDTGNSAREVHGTILPMGAEYLSLGWFNPDAINPKPQHEVKIFGSVGPYWIQIPPGSNVGGSVAVQKTGALGVGEEQQVMELRYGNVQLDGDVLAAFPTNITIRVTLSVLIKPLNDEERQELKKYPNFNEAFKINE